MDNIDFVMMSLQGKISSEHILYIKEKMLKKRDKDLPLLVVQAGLKNNVATLLLAIFLGGLGVHRFYLGDYRMGAAFLASNIIAYVLMFSATFISYALYVVMALVVTGIAIWQFVDIFMSYKRVKTVNFNRLNYVLDMMPDEDKSSNISDTIEYVDDDLF